MLSVAAFYEASTLRFASNGLPDLLLYEISQVEGFDTEAVELSQHRIDPIHVFGNQIQNHPTDPQERAIPIPHGLQ